MADKSLKIPEAVQPAYDAIVARTDALAARHLNDEYALLFRKMAARLARKRPSPLLSGKPESWAAGIAHAIGRHNFKVRTSMSSLTMVAGPFEAKAIPAPRRFMVRKAKPSLPPAGSHRTSTLNC